MEGPPKISKNLKLFNFFVDCNIVDTMLNFVLWYSVVSDVSLEIRCVLVLSKL